MLDSKKMSQKVIECSSSFKINEIHIVDTHFNEDPKNIVFSRETLISEYGLSEILGKMGALTGTPIVMQIGGSQFRKRISAPIPWYQNPCDA